MTDFHSDTAIKATRKPHQCEHCLQTMPAGSAARRGFSVSGGDTFSWYAHDECDAAGCALAEETGNWDEDFQWLHDAEREDLDWLKASHPLAVMRVMERRNLT